MYGKVCTLYFSPQETKASFYDSWKVSGELIPKSQNFLRNTFNPTWDIFLDIVQKGFPKKIYVIK